LYRLDLTTGEVTALTATTGYEGHPTWSPDGLWLAYEVYAGDDLDLWILRVDGSEAPIQLTNAPFLDASPDWGPDGRRIAFVSDRSGYPDVYVANLDEPDESERFTNITDSAGVAEADPVFSPDGRSLAFSARGDGLDLIEVQTLDNGSADPRQLGLGVQPAWDPSGNTLAALLPGPTGSHMVIYPLGTSLLASLGMSPPQDNDDFDWSPHGLPEEAVARAWSEPSASPMPSSAEASTGRVPLARLADIAAPNAQLLSPVEPQFEELRQRASQEIGWDVLGTLENAFVGLNDPLPPGYAFNDWLYTGRAFAVSSAALQTGWLEVAREDYGVETYWRLFVRAWPQDGSRGEPLRVRPWDFTTRASGDPATYDRGGSLKVSIPVGYYVDLTRLADDFGFERVPAMSNWRTYFQAARFNEFAHTDGLTWLEAMLQVYPPEAIVTPTPFHTPTPTPTRTLRPTITPWWWRWLTPSPTYTPRVPTATLTPTP
jgi:TolB protein